MAGLSDKEAAFLAAACAELAKKRDAAPAVATNPETGPTQPKAAPAQPAKPAPARVPLPAAEVLPASAQPAQAIDPAARVAALIEAERAATATAHKRHRLIFLAIPAAIAIIAGIWILIGMWVRR